MVKISRHTDFTFPPYRFIPGENAHPTENPAGHSYGKNETQSEAFDPEDWRANERYLFGVDLYNYGYWWEAHEAFEGLWRAAPKNEAASDFLQGLIKFCAAFLKWHVHQKKGVAKLYKGEIGHLQKVSGVHPHFMGVDLPEYIEKQRKHFAAVAGSADNWPGPMKNYPYLLLTGGEK